MITTFSTSRRHTCAAWAAVALAAVVSFAWSLPLYFLGDDFGYVGRFSELAFSAWPRLFLHEWSEGLWGFPLRELRPMAALSFMIDARLWGANPAGYHLTNLVLHAGCSIVVMLVARDVVKRGWLPAVVAGMLFAAYPVHTEAVTWITGRADLMGAFGCLLGFWAFVRFRGSSQSTWLLLAWAAYFVGIFSKEFCLSLPLLAVGYDVIFTRPVRREEWQRVATPYLGWLVLALVYYWCRTEALGPGLGAPPLAWWTKDFWRQVAQREMVYFSELFWPIAGWLPVADQQRRLALQVLLRLVGAVLLGVGVLWWIDRRRGAADARVVLFFLVVWLVIGTIQFVVTYASARHLYLASAGICLGVIPVLVRLTRTPLVFAGVAGLLVVACEVRLYQNGASWRESARLSAEIGRAIGDVAARAKPEDALILNVPGTFNGTWLWSWASPFGLRPPFQTRDVTTDMIVLERPDAYFHPEGWDAHASIPRLRTHDGAVWLITMEGERVRTSVVPPARQGAVREGAAGLTSPQSFDRFLALVTDATVP